MVLRTFPVPQPAREALEVAATEERPVLELRVLLIQAAVAVALVMAVVLQTRMVVPVVLVLQLLELLTQIPLHSLRVLQAPFLQL